MLRIFSFFGRNWFPLSLAVVFLFALPGLVLSVASLLGYDNEINAWLEDYAPLSYHPALPPPATMLILLVPAFIILLYFLKLKRKPLQVPSTYLWKKSIEDLHVNSLFQWLRQNILLLLQVLCALFLIYGLLGIRFHGSSSHGGHYILVIDNSASMSAHDISPSRLEWAKAEALKEIDAAGPDDFGMVLVFNSKATTLQTYTNNRGKLRQAVRNIEQTERPTRIDEALTLAESLANPVRSTEDTATQPENVPAGQERTFVPVQGVSAIVHLYSDGRFAKLTDANLANLAAKQTGNRLLGNLNLRYHRAGVPGSDKTDNVGITAMSAVRLIDKKTKGTHLDFGKLRILVEVSNYRAKASVVKLHLDVYSGGKMIRPEQMNLALSARSVKKAEPDSEDEDKDLPGQTINPATGKPEPAVFELPAMDLRGNIVLHAYLPDAHDSFALDDHAWLALGTLRKAALLVVGPENPVLDAFFDQEATKELASVEHLPAQAIGSNEYRTKASAGEVDLVIFDRCAPQDESDMPQANALLIDQPPPPWRRGTKVLHNPTIFVSKGGHPLLRSLSTLYDIGVTEAFTIDFATDVNDKVKPLFDLPEGDPRRRSAPVVTKLLETNQNVPVLFTMGRGAFTDLVMTFPLVSDRGELVSNWPLQPSFPLFLRNVLYHLANVDDAARTLSIQPGEPMVLRPEAGVQTLFVTSPSDETLKLERNNRPEFVYMATDRIGLYRVKRGETPGIEKQDTGARSFAVNLLDANESNIEPREEIRIGSERFATGGERPQPQELWKWILCLAVVLLVGEWYIYNKRVAL